MADCWRQFGEGKLELFGQSGVYCGICSYVEFKDHHKLHGLNSYLFNRKEPGTTMTYAAYLSGTSTFSSTEIDAIETARSRYPDLLDPTKQDLYATVFYYVKGQADDAHDLIARLQAAAPGAASATAGYGLLTAGYGLVRVGQAVGAMIAIPAVGITAETPALVLGISTIGVAATGIAGIFVVGGTAYAALQAKLKQTPYQWYSSVWFVPLKKEQLAQMGCTELTIGK